MTAGDDSHCKAAALQAGANDYIAKPFLFNDLLGRIRAHLDIGQHSEVVSPPHQTFLTPTNISGKPARKKV
jgi:DNA-binding response OmpR family regulator